MKKVLVANRGEIAIRIFRACTELGYQTVAIYTYEDRYSLHRYKADESYLIGKENESVRPYLDINEIIQLAKKINADAIHPGYGFLSENSKFVEACEKNGIQFVGPNSTVIGQLGNKVEAKIIAEKAGVPIIKGQHVNSFDDAKRACKETGYPVMLKAASGGGGRGMRVLQNESDLKNGFDSAKREALSAFGDDQVFIEKYIANPKHIEVQILGDQHGQIVHLYERDCSVQRRFQKVIEFAPSMTLDKTVQQRLYDYALKIAKAVNYSHAGTVEFLVENDEIYFVEVNPRIQVEHTVTELVTGVDLVKAQLLIAGGAKLADIGMNLHDQSAIPLNGFAIQCRITTEVPSEDFKPDFGKVMHYRSASGFGIRLDEGNIYNGAVISPFFDSMLVKISAWANTLEAASERMWRALMEFRVRGVKTNVQFLENVMRHPIFNEGKATVHFIKENPDLLNYRKRLDRGSKLLKYIAEVSVNGNPDVKKFDPDKTFFRPKVPDYNPYSDYPNGTKQLLDKLGPEKFSDWLREQKRVQITDTTFRDAHQSLIATRVRSYDILKVAESFAKAHPETFSLEMWGGATFDVAYRFLKEDPWKRLQRIRAAVPNILLQMLIRGSNAVGYTAYPDNLIERFIIKAAENGMDIFRIFDSLNWTEGMRFSIKTVREKTKSIAEACICYTGEVLNKSYQKYNLDYYLKLANELKSMGAHIIAIKDMAGLLKPYSAEYLISELKEKIDLPIHLHTHDTSSLQAATYMKAIESGVDAIDCALGGLSGLTSQPNFNSIVEMLKHTPHELDVNIHSLNAFSDYWATVREIYYPFESGLKSGAADVFYHEIPGGQYSNLQPQAISLGLGDRMPEIKKAYHDVNQLFGDIVKVTPSSKVVGDLALYLVSNGMSVDDIAAKGDSFPFPESVEGFFMGKIGQPHGGFPEAIQKQVLKGKIPFTDRPGAHLKAIDFSKEFEQFKQEFAADLSELDFISYKLYPKVFKDYFEFNSLYGDVDVLPSDIFFYGLRKDKEILIDIAPGKTLIVTLLSISDADDDGKRRVFFEMNGQSRVVIIQDKKIDVVQVVHEKAESNNPKHIAAPLPGLLSRIAVKAGDKVKKDDLLFIIEAMKMETSVTAPADAEIEQLVLSEATVVDGNDLVIKLK